MNRKGFTLIELLAIVVLIGIVGILTVPSVLDAVNASREASYKMLIDNIVTASGNYYMECEYGDLSDTEKYGSYTCQIRDDSINTSLKALAGTGFLKTDGGEITNPNTNDNIIDCDITITKSGNSYIVTNNDSDEKCPDSYEVSSD